MMRVQSGERRLLHSSKARGGYPTESIDVHSFAVLLLTLLPPSTAKAVATKAESYGGIDWCKPPTGFEDAFWVVYAHVGTCVESHTSV